MFSSADGSLQHRKTGISIGQTGMSQSMGNFTLDPRDVEVDPQSPLGRGACGVVSRGIHKKSGLRVAVKAVHVDDKSKREQLMNDIQALVRAQNSPHLVQLYAAYFHRTSGRVHLVLELMEYGSLADLLSFCIQEKTGGIPESVTSAMTRQTLEGLRYLHDHNIVHRDIKPGNILVNSKGELKLSDFGITKTLDNTLKVCDTFVGTAIYMSPERATGNSYSFSADIWSLGLVVYELLTLAHPFPPNASFPVLFDCLCSRPEPRMDNAHFSRQCCAFVEQALVRDTPRRATAQQLLEQEFILQSVDDSSAQKAVVHHFQAIKLPLK